MKAWIHRNRGLLMIGVLLLVARAVQVVIFMYYENLNDLLTSLFSIFK